MIFLLFVFVLLYQPHQKQNGPQPKQKSQAVDHSVSYTPCGVQRVTQGFNLMHPMRGATTFSSRRQVPFQSNAPRAGCNSKTIQSKRILVARRMYSFANYVLHILKHLPTYCIGTTLQSLIFGAKLPVILC